MKSLNGKVLTVQLPGGDTAMSEVSLIYRFSLEHCSRGYFSSWRANRVYMLCPAELMLGSELVCRKLASKTSSLAAGNW